MAKLGVQIVGDPAGLKAALGESLAATQKWADGMEGASVRVTDAFKGVTTASLQQAVAADKLAMAYGRYGEGSLGAAAATVRYRKELDALSASANAGFRTVGRTLTTYVSLPMAVVGYEAVKMGVSFNAAMLRIQTQAGASAAEVKNLSGQVLALAGVAPQGPTELAQGLYHLESIGLRGAKAMDTLKIASFAAGMGMANLEDAASALGGAVVSGINGAQNYTQAMGTLNATVGAGNMTMQDLLDALGTGLLPKAKNAGVSLKEVGAALAVLTDRGIGAQKAATQLGTTFALMLGPSKAARKALSDMGIGGDELSRTLHGPGGLGAALDLLRAGMEKVGKIQGTKDILEAFGRSRQSGAILTLVESLDSALSNYHGKLAQVDAGQKKYAADQKAYLESPSYKLHAAWAQLEGDLTRLGLGLMPVVTKAAKVLSQDINALTGAFSALPGPIKEALGIAIAGLAVGGPLMLGLAAIQRSLVVLRGAVVLGGISGIGTAADGAATEVGILQTRLSAISGLTIAAITIPIVYDVTTKALKATGAYGKIEGLGALAAGGSGPSAGGARGQVLDAISIARSIYQRTGGNISTPDVISQLQHGYGGRFAGLGHDELLHAVDIGFAEAQAQTVPGAGEAGAKASAGLARAAAARAAAQASAAASGNPSTPTTSRYTLSRVQELNLALAKNPNSRETIAAKLAYDREAAAFAEKRIAEGRGNKKLVQQLQNVYADEAALQDQLSSLAKKKDENAKKAAKAAAQFKIPLNLQVAQALAATTAGTGDDAKADAAIAAYIRGRLPHLKGQARLTALQDLAGVTQGKTAGFAVPLGLQLAVAKAGTTSSTADDVAAAKAIKAYDLKLLASHRESIQSQIDIYDSIAQQNSVLGQKVLGKAYAASSAVLTAGLGLSHDQRVALEQRISQSEAHGDHIPAGLGAGGGGTVIIHVHGDSNPDRTADRVLKKLQQKGHHGTATRRGAHAGSYMGLH